MKHCTSCGAALTDDAKFCGSCGAASEPGSGTSVGSAPIEKAKPGMSIGKKIGLGLLLGLVLIFLIEMCSGPVDNSKEISSKGRVVTVAPTDVTARELFDAYQANEARAQAQYGGKPLRVTGVLDGVDLDFSDEPTLKLKTSNQFMSAQASLIDKEQPKAANLDPGKEVVLLCQEVSEIMGMPMLKECAIESPAG